MNPPTHPIFEGILNNICPPRNEMPSKKPIDTEALSEIMRVTSIPTQHPTVFWDGIPAAHEGFTFQVVSAYLLKMGHPTETAYHLAGNTGGSVRVRLASCLKQLANI